MKKAPREKLYRYAGHVAHVRYDEDGNVTVTRGDEAKHIRRFLCPLTKPLRRVAAKSW